MRIILEDFRTRHRVHAHSDILITWQGDTSKGTYQSWVTKDFIAQLREVKQELVDDWIKRNAKEAKSWKYTLQELPID